MTRPIDPGGPAGRGLRVGLRTRRLLFLVLALGLTGLAAPATGLAADRYVDDRGTDSGPNSCTDLANPCLTIPHGLTQAQIDETVFVAGGTYTTSNVVDDGKSLLFSDFTGEGLPAILNNGAASSPAVRVPDTSPAGTIQGFTIRSNHSPVQLEAFADLRGNTFDQTNIPGNLQADVVIGKPGAPTPVNISPVVRQNTFTDSAAPADDQKGVQSISSGSPQITQNTFANFQAGIQVGSGGTPVISRNEISGVRSGTGTETPAGIYVSEANPTVTDNLVRDFDAGGGIIVSDFVGGPLTGATLRRNRIFVGAGSIGVGVFATGLPVTLEGDVLADSSNYGLQTDDSANPAGPEGNVTATNVTIADNAGSDVRMEGTALTLDSSIVGDGGVEIAVAGAADASCSISFSNGPNTGACGPLFSSNVPEAMTGFKDTANRDYHLAAGSPMIDAGNPSTSSSMDFDGDVFNLDGNGDCTARRDIGWDEFVPASFPSCAAGGPGTPGRVDPPPPPPPPPPPQDKTAPGATLTMGSAFPAADAGSSIAQRRKTGTTVSYRLTEAANVRFTVERLGAGRKVGRRCVKQNRSNRAKRRCKLYRRVKGSFSHTGKQGPNSFRFTGRLNRRKLPIGRYRLVAVPTDAAGNRGKAARRNFRIIP
jgi:Right handed beta helix region